MIDQKETLLQVIGNFLLDGTVEEVYPYGSGHINDTYRLVMRQSGGTRRYILQRMNDSIFTNPVGLMENIVNVTSFLRKKIIEKGGDPERETLNIVPARDGKSYYKSQDGSYWRIYLFVEGTTSFDRVEKPDDFYQSAVSFGNFQRLLSDFPAQILHETIPDFHNTVDRYAKFQEAVKLDPLSRARSAEPEIRFIEAREAETHILCDKLARGELPLRVTHNDTKLNNILIDNATGKGICVIDLDTVMPGLVLNDFGDSIRFGASTAAEDETDLSKVSCDLELFEVYVRGFLAGCGGSLTEAEISMLATGAKLMTLECGMRFLTDYLLGDSYFKIHRENHNLDRCRTQLKLVADMEEKWQEMEAIVARCSKQ